MFQPGFLLRMVTQLMKRFQLFVSIMGGMLISFAAYSQDLSSKTARQEAFVSAAIYNDILSTSRGDESELGVKKTKAENVAIVANRIAQQFLSGGTFTDIPRRHDAESRGLLFLMYYLGGTVPATSPCLSRDTFDKCDDATFPIEDIAVSAEFRRAYQEARPRMRLPAIDAAFPFLTAE